jgi:pimeloyl-ACP methyl ester carboxylesterase
MQHDQALMNQPRSHLARRGFLTRLVSSAVLGAGGLAVAGARSAAQEPQGTPLSAGEPAITHRQIETNGISMHIAEAGTGPLVVLVHGWPELWYSWRHQLPALAAAGYHAVALDLRGYGESDAPPEIASYSMRNQIADILGLLDALDAEQAVLVGHDIGAGITWACAELHPERIAAHVTLGIPYGPRGQKSQIEMTEEFAGDNFSFLGYFQKPGVAEAELEVDPRRSLRQIMYALSGDAPPDLVPYLFTGKPADAGILDGMPDPATLPPWLSEADLDVYAEAYERTGFRGSFGFYRNFDHDWQDLPEVGTLGVQQPALFIGGWRDSAVIFTGFEALEAMIAAVPNLRKIVLLPGVGHWAQQESPDAVNFELIGFLQSEFGQ